jgi:hypothetical protein
MYVAVSGELLWAISVGQPSPTSCRLQPWIPSVLTRSCCDSLCPRSDLFKQDRAKPTPRDKAARQQVCSAAAVQVAVQTAEAVCIHDSASCEASQCLPSGRKCVSTVVARGGKLTKWQRTSMRGVLKCAPLHTHTPTRPRASPPGSCGRVLLGVPLFWL